MWLGYQVWPAFLAGVSRHEYHGQRVDIAELRERVPDCGTVGRREIFQSKRVLRERFETYTGWGSLLRRHFIEGFLHKGSLVLGTLYDMIAEQPRIVYSGFFLQGTRHGPFGESYYPDGSLAYRGEWQSDEMHGRGTTFWKNGSLQYEGQFRWGVKEGLGTQHWATGSYEGEWQQNAPHGNGCWRWKDATKFVGCMKAGKREGFGILFYPQKDGEDEAKVEYEAEWSDDLINGKVKHYDKNGILCFDGCYAHGLKQGFGQSYKNIGGKAKLSYEGEYYAGKKEGRGTKYDAKTGRVIYQGQWQKGLYHGKGRLGGASGMECEFRHGHAKNNGLDDSFSLLTMDEEAVVMQQEEDDGL